VHPAALLAGRRIHLAQGSPETERTVTDGKLWRYRQAPRLEVEQQF